MSDLITLFKKDVFNLIDDLENRKIIDNIKKNSISIDYASKSKQGDLSTNILLVLFKKNLDEEFDIKKYISNYLLNLKYVEEIEIAKIGFININIKKQFLISKIIDGFSNDFQIDCSEITSKKINIEFVSANPTGPIHVAHMRGAVLGDVLGSILTAVGHKVTREYYVNDAGSQIKTLGTSLFKRYQELFGISIKIKDSEYPGNYLIDLANEIRNIDGDKWIKFIDDQVKNKYFESYAVTHLIKNIQKDLSLININFDKFTFESEIVNKKIIDKVFQILDKKSLIYEGFLEKPLGEENLNWQPRKQLLFRSTNFSDDTDRAFKKADGEWTYFANDTAYHYDKFLRGYDKLINIWGADHIGYISRMKSIVDVFSEKRNYLDIFVCQIVRLIKDGVFLKMSKRDGNFVSLKNIYKEVGTDPLRYFMISSKSETPMDFNMNKVIEKNKDNPVFYCQYAYARASSVLRKASTYKKFINLQESFKVFDEDAISSYEWKIVLKLLSWPYLLKQAAENKQPHRITNYLEDLCSHFHSFWNMGKDNSDLRIIDENEVNKTISKLIWISYFQRTLNQIFTIIGIDSPETM